MAISRIQQFRRTLERQTILDTAPPALREKLLWIDDWFSEDWKRSILGRYQISLHIRDIYLDVMENNGGRYGAQAVQMIRNYFGWDQGTIYQALKVTEAYTLEEVEAIAGMRFPNGQPVTYTHLVSLADEEDDDRRQKLLTQTVKKGWTSGKVAREVRENSPPQELPEGTAPKEEVRRGRPIGVPRDFDATLDQQGSFARDFLSRDEQVWAHSEHSLSARVGRMNTSDFTAERMERLRRYAAQMNLVAIKARERADEMKAVRDFFERSIREQETKARTLALPAPPEEQAPE
jgi:hypothetical protein